MENCIFCKIINQEIPSYKIYEDEHVYAFLDITQVTKGHTLVIPKEHHATIFELPPEIASNLYRVIPHISSMLNQAFNPIGLNIINNNNKPLQSVFHYHIHLIPRYQNDGFNLSFTSSSPSQEILSEVHKQIIEKGA
jgi:histidine triad (HIT) family protein